MTTPEILLAATRYEKLRKLNPQQHALLWGDSLFTDTPFDELVDALPEPFCTKIKEGSRTCQTCKHWGNNINSNGESFDFLTRECKEIFEKLTDPNDLCGHLPFFNSFATAATFACNGYEQVT